MKDHFNNQIPRSLQKAKITEPLYSNPVKVQTEEVRSHYSVDEETNEIPESDGTYGDLEDEKETKDSYWILEDQRIDKKFRSAEEVEEEMEESQRFKKPVVEEVGEVEFHGFKSTGYLNRAGSIVFRHDDLSIGVYAQPDPVSDDNRLNIQIQRVEHGGRNIETKTPKVNEYTVKNVYGKIKEVIENELVLSIYKGLTDFEKALVDEVKERSSLEVAEYTAENLRKPKGDIHQTFELHNIPETRGRIQEAVTYYLEYLRENRAEYGLEDANLGDKE